MGKRLFWLGLEKGSNRIVKVGSYPTVEQARQACRFEVSCIFTEDDAARWILTAARAHASVVPRVEVWVEGKEHG